MKLMENAMTGRGASASYDVSTIEVLEGLEPIRRRPGMYVGDCADGSGLHHLVWGLVEEALLAEPSRQPFRIAVTIHAAGAVTVEHDGPGIPAGACRGDPVLERCFTAMTMQLQGMGSVAACALSEWLVAETRCEGRVRRQEFARGKAVAPERDVGPADGTGVRVTLRPDPSIFATTRIDARRLATELQTRGLREWAERMREGQQGLPEQVVEARGTAHGIEVDAAFGWVWSSGERLVSFVNDQRTDHGPHEVGLVWGVASALRGRVTAERGPRPKLTASRIRRGLVGALAIRHPEPRFDACRRTIFDEDAKLATRDVVERAMRRPLFEPELVEALLARLCEVS
jgi:DNA gyrase/topoisomerase IV subunit B